jgi:hypothetical protein
LGQRIVEELGLAEGVDTLGRWMSHYLAEQIERANAAPDGAEGDAARRECVDLILRLWERRHHWPLSAPLKEVSEELNKWVKPTPHYFPPKDGVTEPWPDLLHRLQDLHRQEEQLCRTAWVAGQNLTQDREYLQDHSDHLSDEECEVVKRLIELQDQVCGPDALLAGEPCPNFGNLAEDERQDRILKRLHAIAIIRDGLIGPKNGIKSD